MAPIMSQNCQLRGESRVQPGDRGTGQAARPEASDIAQDPVLGRVAHLA